MANGMIEGISGTAAPEPVLPVGSPGAKSPSEERPPPVEDLQPKPQTEPVLSPEELRGAAEALGSAVELLSEKIRVEFDDSTGRFITQIINVDTNEVVRQIPPEELMDVLRRLRDFVGLLFDVEV